MSISFQDFQNYISKHYPDIDIKAEHTLCGPVTIKFNTTEDESAEFVDRINQGVERARSIWEEIFIVKSQALWVIAYEYFGEQLIEYDSEYLFEHFAVPHGFILLNEMLDTGFFANTEKGEEMTEGRIILGKVLPSDINITSLLRGIANKDSGIDPMIGQSVYFFDPIKHTGFHMYDDRGFFIWSTESEKIKEIYHKHFAWIPEYTKEDIQPHFI